MCGSETAFDNIVQEGRDPRFDSLSGGFSEARFRKHYGFLDEAREGKIAELRKALRSEKDEAARERMEREIQKWVLR